MTRIRFEDLPSTNTPRNAENLNKLNNVVTSPTEPTTGEEVWIQKGKNLFNKQIAIRNGISLSGTGDIEGVETAFTQEYFIKVQPLTTYTLSTSVDITSVASSRLLLYEYGENYVAIQRNIEREKNYLTITTTENSKYLRVCASIITLDTLQLEQGSTATTYEPYIAKKIHTKNDNNVYEEFYKEENLQNYSTTEQRIGTWIDGKPLYRKTIVLTGGWHIGRETTISHNISNFKRITDCRVSATRADGAGQVFPNVFAEDFKLDMYDFTANDFKIFIGQSFNEIFNLTEIDITLEYTKTTD